VVLKCTDGTHVPSSVLKDMQNARSMLRTRGGGAEVAFVGSQASRYPEHAHGPLETRVRR
jgi:hypothetical protein